MSDELRVGFVTGTTPDKWARAWRDRRSGPLALVPVTEDEQESVVRRGDVDLCLVRLPVDTSDLHCVRLYDERPVAVAGRDHLISAATTLTLDELSGEQLVRPHASGWRPATEQLAWPAMTEGEAIATVASGTGVVIVPMSVARRYHRRDVVVREVTDLPPTTVALVWRRDRDDDTAQAFVGVVKGRTVNSSRG
ncbi:MAG: LysR family substrate-binding domain-containing protein [Nocardioides sp.]